MKYKNKPNNKMNIYISGSVSYYKNNEVATLMDTCANLGRILK